MITLNLILTLKPDPYLNPNQNPNPTYSNKPTEPYQTVLTQTDTVGLQCGVILKSAISAYSAIDRYQAPLPALNITIIWEGQAPSPNLTPLDRTPGPSEVMSASLDRTARPYSPYRAPFDAKLVL